MSSNKTILLTRINVLRKELDELENYVISLEEPQTAQATPIVQHEPDLWLTPKQVYRVNSDNRALQG